LDEGLSLKEVGRRIGCAPSSVMHWRDMRRRGGEKALKVRSSPGRPPKLSLAACRSLLKSCRPAGVDPFLYLRDVLRRLATHPQRLIAQPQNSDSRIALLRKWLQGQGGGPPWSVI
jgi:hypothetical protein